ncbi:adenylate kinase 9-like [Nomia melanderi]|uniref:adenylate kinase 9-like n=1 Tax=Nomia melanderi TaxID=2448451 RepID=UPI003FCE4C66
MCDKSFPRERPDARGKDKFHANASCIVKKSFFRYIKGHPRDDHALPWPEPHRCVYPKANSYYAFHEDANPLTRFTEKRVCREYGNVEPHFESPKHPYTTRDPYCETEARSKYLRTVPTCFVIFGKPDLNTSRLAAMIADSWKCVLVSPLHLVKQETEQGSERGKLLSDVLKTGECLGVDIINSLIEDRLNKTDVLHRGYVVEGLPMIPNKMLEYPSPSNYSSERAGDRDLTENFMKLFGPSFRGVCSTIPDFNESRGAPASCIRGMPLCAGKEFSNKTCTTRFEYERFICNQIDEMFAAWPIKPSVIIYAVCPDEDFVRKRRHFRMDTRTGRTVDTSLTAMNKDFQMSFGNNRTENDVNVSLELYQEMTNEQPIFEHRTKYLLKRISDRKSNVRSQCELYKRFAMPAIDKWILLHKPENVIRVDGRGAVSQMFQTVISRLRTLPIPRVILPKRFLDSAELKLGGESPAVPTSIDEFVDMSNEEAFQYLTNRETVSPMFPWTLSTWNYICPVELAKGRSTEGSSEFAVRFMNKIFFLSSAEAIDSFLENPRAFLVPFSPRPTCKMAVLGPRRSGKSSLCKVLAETFGGVVIDPGNSDSDSFFDSDIDLHLRNKADFVVNQILGIPKEEVSVGIWRDGGYIVDGMYLDIDSWKIITEDSKIVFEDVIVLYDEDPYEYLLSKWQRNRNVRKDFEENVEFLSDEDEEGTEGLIEYLRHIQQFQLDWEELRETIVNSCRNLVICDLSKIRNVPTFVVENIKDRYADKAKIMSDDEKERERDLAEYMAMSENTENVDEEEELGGEGHTAAFDDKEDNPRLGDTDRYCPVALMKYNVFWKGKEDFSALFMDKIYRLSSDAALQEFIRGPRKLSLPFHKPLSAIPPLRVAIIGPLGSGKTALANAISREYGIARVDYFKSFEIYMRDRGMPSFLHKSSLISSHNVPGEVDLPADLDDERYNSDTATVETFIRRYWQTGGVLPKKMLRECLLKPFEGLYNLYGVAMEQFPSCPEDVNAALKHYAVPEIIIELRCDKETARRRIFPELMKSWRETLAGKKRIEQSRYLEKMERYRKTESLWVKTKLNEAIYHLSTQGGEASSWHSFDDYGDASRLTNVVSNIDHDDDTDDDDDSYIKYNIDSEIISRKRQELVEVWRRENPEPVLFTDWEDYEAAESRIQSEFEETYANETRMIDATRKALEHESIPYVRLNAEESFEDVLLRAMVVLTPYTSRDISILERPYAIDLETAETLLDCGYYLLSSFGRWCPVQLYRNQIPLQMFLPLEARQEISPVIHRQFVYFLGGEDARSAFLKNPFKYLEQDSCAPVIPFRLSIIGPPKCGKTSLARRFAQKYGLKVVTRGAALRHLLKYFPWSKSAQLAESHLREGRAVPEESVLRAVEMYSIDPRSIAQGFVFDGFPSDRKEFEKLTLLGVQPAVILNLNADLAFCSSCLSREADRARKPPSFSGEFLEHRYASWEADQGSFREWLRKYTQNVIEIDAARSTWHAWTRADREVCLRYARIRSYFRESDYDKCHSLKFMNVSPYEFKSRQSKFESYCPGCLLRDGAMRSSGVAPDQEGTFQFRGHFYWICSRHLNDFLLDPQTYLPPVNTVCLPEHRPRVLTETIDVEHFYWASRLRVDGHCLVSYADNMPNRKLVPGRPDTGVLYRDRAYLFCTEDCRDKFLAHPDKYASVDIKFSRSLAPVSVKDLPNLGFLEQTVAKALVEAVNQVSAIRPKLPGLSPSASAAVYIGVYLKTRNVSCALKESGIYETVCRRMCARYKMIKTATRTMKKKLNPFVTVPVYPEKSIRVKSMRSRYSISKQVSMLAHLFPRTPNAITFRRTSPTQTLVEPSDESDD